MNQQSPAIIRIKDVNTGAEYSVETKDIAYVQGDTEQVRRSAARKVTALVPEVKYYVASAIVEEWASSVGRRTLLNGWWHIGGGIQLHAEAK